MGTIISQLNSGIFGNKVLTFSEKPEWIDLSDCKNNSCEIVKKIAFS
jgi:hypothetical protein